MLHLYNSLTKEKEVFTPLKKGVVTMYNCGPTVYDFAHIGNLRSFLFADLLRRYLEYSGYQVRQVMNITDVGHALADEDTGEDKIEAAAEKEKMSPHDIARKYEKAFFEDIKKLKISPAWKYPRASEHVAEMIEIIKKLFKNGYAYVGKDNSVYFDVSKFKNYGELSGNRLENLMTGARVEENLAKKNPFDFVLWIINPKHLMQWNSPWGRGYPGWHIECSAMSMKYLGQTIDIHTGGEDNKFPHHESEIAQSEGATSHKFVRFWLHTKHLLVDGEKMSKSKGNFYTLNDVLEGGREIPHPSSPFIKGGGEEGDLGKKYSARAVRELLLSAHYRDELNFTFESLKAAGNSLCRLDEFYTRLLENVAAGFSPRRGKKSKGLPKPQKFGASITRLIQEMREDFKRALDDDLNVPKALAVIFDFVNRANLLLDKKNVAAGFSPRSGVDKSDIIKARRLMNEFDKVLGLGLKKIEKVAIPKEIQELLKQREVTRKEKNWQKADEIRKEIEEKGYLIEDTAIGPQLKRLD